MVKCSIRGCTNYQGKKEAKPVRFFCFPKNETQSKEWLRACGQTVDVSLSIARICSEHFGENEWKLQDILLNVPIHKRKIKPGAIPSLNLPKTSKSPSKHEERTRKQEQMELVQEAISIYDRKHAMQLFKEFGEPEVEAAQVTKNLDHTEGAYDIDDPLGKPGPEAENLKRQNKALKICLKKLERRLHLANTAISSAQEILSKRQIKRVKYPNRKFKWTYDDISYAASLYSAGPNAYAQLIKGHYPFPTPATLKKWSATTKLTPGILENVIQMLSCWKLEAVERLCILSFHEITLKSEFYGPTSNNKEQHKSAQVIVVRGLTKEWTQIVYYNFVCSKASALIKDIICTLKKINFTVVAVVSGVGHMEHPLWEEMNVDHHRPYAEVISGEKVFFFGNISQLIKNFRNVLVETGFDVNGTPLNVDPLKELLSNTPDAQQRFKLTEAHLSAKKITRQNVQLAWELFSSPVADALKLSISLNRIHSEYAVECSDLIQLFSTWLDIFNAKCTSGDEINGPLAYGLDLVEQQAVLSLMTDLMSTLNRPKSKKLFPFQRGILLNNAALSELHNYLREKYDIGYVITNYFNQDDLMQSLKIRPIDRQPTTLELKYRINSAVLSNLKEIKYK